MTGLIVSLVTLAGVALTALVTWSIAQRRIAVEHVTAERAKWRETIRLQGLLAREAILRGDEVRLGRLKSRFRALLNPFDPMDRKLLDCMKVVDECCNARQKRADDFEEHISLLLKHDWDRAKLEAGFILGRWVLKARRWGLDWKSGIGGMRRATTGLQWHEKHQIRPVRILVLIVLLDTAAITFLGVTYLSLLVITA